MKYTPKQKKESPDFTDYLKSCRWFWIACLTVCLVVLGFFIPSDFVPLSSFFESFNPFFVFFLPGYCILRAIFPNIKRHLPFELSHVVVASYGSGINLSLLALSAYIYSQQIDALKHREALSIFLYSLIGITVISASIGVCRGYRRQEKGAPRSTSSLDKPVKISILCGICFVLVGAFLVIFDSSLVSLGFVCALIGSYLIMLGYIKSTAAPLIHTVSSSEPKKNVERKWKVDTSETSIRIMATLLTLLALLTFSFESGLESLKKGILIAISYARWSEGLWVLFIFFVGISLPFLAMGTFLFSPSMIRRKFHLTPLSKDHPVYRDVRRLVDMVGLGRIPNIMIDDGKTPNCFLFGRTNDDAELVISKGLLEYYTSEEIDLILLHELGHQLNKDVAFTTWGIAFLDVSKYWYFLYILILLASFFQYRSVIFLNVLLLTLVLFVVLPQFMIRSALRTREFLADATAASFLENKSKLVSVIEKNYVDQQFVYLMAKTTEKPISEPEKFVRRLLSIHPPLPKRVSALAEEKYAIQTGKNVYLGIEASICSGFTTAYLFLLSTVLFPSLWKEVGMTTLIISLSFVLQNTMPILRHGDVKNLNNVDSVKMTARISITFFTSSVGFCILTTILVIISGFPFSFGFFLAILILSSLGAIAAIAVFGMFKMYIDGVKEWLA